MADRASQRQFVEACRQAFRFLVTDFQFREVATPREGNPFAAWYAKDDVRLCVEGISYGAGVNVTLVTPHDQLLGLAHLLSLRDERVEDRIFSAPSQVEQMREWAEALRELAGDALAGDLGVLAEARRHQNHVYRRESRRRHLSDQALTSAGWSRCADPTRLSRHLCERARVQRRKSGRRRLRLVACGLARQVWALLPDERSRRAVMIAEEFADGVPAEGWEGARSDAERAVHETASPVARAAARAALATLQSREQDAVLWALPAGHGAGDQLANQVALIRDVFANPFRPPPKAKRSWLAWKNGTAEQIALSIYQANRFGEMPVLADALEEAGCTDDAFLSHCRRGGPHCRGCWAVDAILRKEGA
jgi:hypothetical protein